MKCRVDKQLSETVVPISMGSGTITELKTFSITLMTNACALLSVLEATTLTPVGMQKIFLTSAQANVTWLFIQRELMSQSRGMIEDTEHSFRIDQATRGAHNQHKKHDK